MNNEKNQIASLLAKQNYSLIVIYWPTGSGKTWLSIQVAKFLENLWKIPFIVSADSRQVYQEMDIWTGKIRPDEMANIQHIGLNIISPREQFSVVEFQKHIIQSDFWKNFEKNEKFFPIICGGTGLYIDSLIFERTYLGTKPNPDRRKNLEKFRQQNGNEALWEKLYNLDPDYAQDLHPNNYNYIIRAIEIFEDTGKSKKSTLQEPSLKYKTLFLTPYTDTPENRATLYEDINARINEMFKLGLVEEVRFLKKKYGDCLWLRTIGYKEVIDFLEGYITQSETIELIAQHNRNYAKKQITWNRKKYDKFLKNEHL